ncbi:hypothetical protein B0H16DRAFT_1891105 [Mycena metata]|uniref:Uncharacterized protein n=1 Tax=Mycena metata TaxID=1033252 RepID=A0AAD7IB41_9AGAR|nr:hypothetical protein B0H16DRAFT_1891105 [Mycena metata]
MSFYGSFPATAGPNDPTPIQPPIQLSPEQFLAFQQFQFAQLLHRQPPPAPPQVPLPVIDPRLQDPVPLDSNQRISDLEREVKELKAQKRSNSNTSAPSPKRRKKSKNSTLYILRDKKGLSTKQKQVRKELMQKVKMEIGNLTGMVQTPADSDSDGEADTSASTSVPSRPTLSFNFNANVDAACNVTVLDRAADLIWREQKDTTSATFSLSHTDVPFTRADLIAFGKNNFRGWRRDWKAKNDHNAAVRKARQASKDRQGMRRKEMKSNRLGAVKEYKKLHQKNPACILESDFMTDEISAPDTDDQGTKDEYKNKLREAAGLRPEDTQPVWEVVRPDFQSSECIDVKSELDRLLQVQKSTRKKTPRASAIRVSLGNTHSRIPSSTLWPFMVSDDWYKANIEGNIDLEQSMQMYDKNPEGFGEDGYAGDDEGA